MENSLVAERAAAQGSLAGWRKMVRKAVHAETGHLEEDSVRERLKSLDAAWVRFDKAHHSLMNSMAHDKKEEEQEDWERQMEEYCLVKEEGIAALKKFDLSNIQDIERHQTGSTPADLVPRAHHHHHPRHHAKIPHLATQQTSSQDTTEQQHPRHQTRAHMATAAAASSQEYQDSQLQVLSMSDLECAVRDDLVISGHQDFNSLYAANDTEQQSFTVNTLGAPNNSTTVCGCDNINCPFCNIVMSMRNKDPDL